MKTICHQVIAVLLLSVVVTSLSYAASPETYATAVNNLSAGDRAAIGESLPYAQMSSDVYDSKTTSGTNGEWKVFKDDRADIIRTTKIDPKAVANSTPATAWSPPTETQIYAIDNTPNTAKIDFSIIGKQNEPVQLGNNGPITKEQTIKDPIGFHASAYTNGNTVAIVYEGTGDLKDWVVDAEQAPGGIPDQYKYAVDFAQKVIKENPGKQVVFTGHSLGGGLATYAYYKTGTTSNQVYTFNAAGLGEGAYQDAQVAAKPELTKNVKSFIATGYPETTGVLQDNSPRQEAISSSDKLLGDQHINPIYVPVKEDRPAIAALDSSVAVAGERATLHKVATVVSALNTIAATKPASVSASSTPLESTVVPNKSATPAMSSVSPTKVQSTVPAAAPVLQANGQSNTVSYTVLPNPQIAPQSAEKKPVTSVSTPAIRPPTTMLPGSGGSPGTMVSSLTPVFSWNPASSATGYGLYIRDMTASGTPIIYPNASGTTARPLTGTSFTMQSGVLVGGHTYRWNMTSFNGSTESTAASGVLYFRTPAPSGSASAQPTQTPHPTLSTSSSPGSTNAIAQKQAGSTPSAPSSVNPTNSLSSNGGIVGGNVKTSTVSTPAIRPPTTMLPGSSGSPGATVSSLTPVFSWNPASGATGYGLYIRDMTASGTPIIYPNASGTTARPLTGTSFTMQSGVLVSGHNYRWNMTSFNGSTESTAASGVLYFRTPAAAVVSSPQPTQASHPSTPTPNTSSPGNPTNSLANSGGTASGNVKTSVATSPKTSTASTPAINPPTTMLPGSSGSPGATVSSLTPVFSWNPVNGATGYGLYIRDMTASGAPIIYPNASGTTARPLTGISFTMPSGVLVSGHTYRWNMTSFNGSTESVAVSGVLYFRTPASAVASSSQPTQASHPTTSTPNTSSPGNPTTSSKTSTSPNGQNQTVPVQTVPAKPTITPTPQTVRKYTVTVQANPGNGGTMKGNGTYVTGSSLAVTALPNTGYAFSCWMESGKVVSTSAVYNFILNSDRNLIANFQRVITSQSTVR